MADEKTGDEKVTKLTDDPAFVALDKTVKGLAMLLQQGQQQQMKMQENFTEALKGLSTKSKDDVPDDVKLDAINDLDNAGLMSLVVEEVSKVVDKKIGGVAETIQDTRKDISDSRVQLEAEELMKGNPDFMDWKSEMAALAKENPTLSLTRVYGLAKLENPEKAEELAEKYSDDGDKDTDPGFLSLMPTGGDYDDSEEKPTKKEAMDKGWDETVAQFPALASMGDD